MEHIKRNNIQAYSKLELIARQVVEGFITGMHKSPFHGFSVEFAEHRLYNVGESTRHIDWKLYGKTDKLFVKRYEEETNLRCQIVIDHSASMYIPFESQGNFESPNKISFSVYAAAAIIEILKRQRDAFGLTIFADEIDEHYQARSNEAHQHLIFDSLEKILDKQSPQENRKSNIAKNIHQIADITHKRSLIIIFSDFFENKEDTQDILTSLQHLKHYKNEVILFHVVNKNQELDFDFKNRPYKFIDPESGEVLKLNPQDFKEQFRKNIGNYTKELKLKCGLYNIDFVEVDINKGFNEILLPYFMKRKKMN